MRKLVLLVFALIALAVAGPVAAQPLEKLRLTYSAIGGSQASFWVPYEAGIFRKYGLDVELLYVAGGGRAAQVVQSGEVPIGVFTGGAVINSALAGGDLVEMIARPSDQIGPDLQIELAPMRSKRFLPR